MYRIPNIFSHNSDRRKSRSESDSGSMDGSNRRAAKPKPKLDRRNAKKNINYDFSPSTSASTSSASSFFSSSEESIRHRSKELYGGRTNSFRIDGSEGEIEILCKAMGFSGVEDFGIPYAEFEAMKMRSSSAPVFLSEPIETLVDREIRFNYDNVDASSRDGEVVSRSSNGDLISSRCAEAHDLASPSYNNVNTSRFNVYSSFGDDVTVRNSILSDNVSERSNNGIKGLRPPVLAPPPSMSVPVIDQGCSAWDIVRSFAPESDTRFARLDRGVSLDDDEGFDRQRMMSGKEDNYPLSESYSFTASSNDDSSSSTTPLSSVSPNGIFGRVIENWQKGDLLGRGSFGSVYEGIAANGFFFAVKEVSLLEQEDEGRQSILQLEQEISLLSQFEHENIVKYYGTKKDESRLYIFLELVTKGSLLSLYRRYDLVDTVVSAYTRQILLGLKYLHDKGVVHRDIKCANILVHSNGLVKLADFGLAKATKLNDVKSCKGTPYWMAPEVVRNVGYGLPADIWSLGCTVLEMLTRSFPYSNLELGAAIFRIGQGKLPDIPNTLSSDARDFILRCLKVNPSLRPTAEQLLEHPFVKRSLLPTSSSPSPRHFHRHS